MIDLKSKVVVITGAGNGIGRALALEMARKGAKVVINDIDNSTLEESKNLLNEVSDGCGYFCADISIRDEVIAFSDYVKNEFGHADLLINNAGVSLGRLNAVDIPADLNEWIFNVNYWGAVNCVNSFVPIMPLNSGSKIVNICSLYSYLSVYQRSAYCASKSAIKSYSASLRYELKNLGIDVISVFPGMVNSKIVENSKGWRKENEQKAAVGLQKKYAKLSSSVAAGQILKGVLKNKKRIVVGLDAKLTIQLLRFFPNKGEEWINKLILYSENRSKRKFAKKNDTLSMPSLNQEYVSP